MSPTRLSDAAVDESLRRAQLTLGYMPTQLEWVNRGLQPNYSTLRRRFGSWASVRAHAAQLVPAPAVTAGAAAPREERPPRPCERCGATEDLKPRRLRGLWYVYCSSCWQVLTA